MTPESLQHKKGLSVDKCCHTKRTYIVQFLFRKKWDRFCFAWQLVLLLTCGSPALGLDLGHAGLPVADHGLWVEECPGSALLEDLDGRVAVETAEAVEEQLAVGGVRGVRHRGVALLTVQQRGLIGCGGGRGGSGRGRGNWEKRRKNK